MVYSNEILIIKPISDANGEERTINVSSNFVSSETFRKNFTYASETFRKNFANNYLIKFQISDLTDKTSQDYNVNTKVYTGYLFK